MAAIDESRWQRISPLLDELLEADEAARAQRLRVLRQEDPQLADKVTALLAQQRAVETVDFLGGTAMEVPSASLAGQVIGSYTIERSLGAGGMGSVWLARRSDGRFEGLAAVKLLNLALVSRGGAERFGREGSLLAKLAHPNIAHLIDAGVARGGQPYLVLEYIDGVPIDQYCDRQALPVRARLRLFLDVLAAVAHAHTQLVLHRDLKPSNILVDTNGRVKLLDFGVAKLMADADRPAQATALTLEAGRAFTPEFAAPEQVRGDDVTTATDVYALGVLLYLLLSGRHPLAAASRPDERLRAVLERDPAPLAVAAARADPDAAARRASSPARLVRDLRGDLENIVARALKKSPAERYPTAAALADDLRRFLDDQPVAARPDSLRYRAAKFIRRHRVGVGAATISVLAVLAGSAGIAWQAREASRARDMALAQLQRAEATNRLLSVVISEVSAGGGSFTPGELLARAERWANRLYADDPRLHAELLLLLGDRIDHTDGERALGWYREAQRIAQPLGDPELSAAADCRVAVKLAITGTDVEAAHRTIDAALRSIADRPPGNTVRTRCLINANYAAAESGDVEAAVALAERAVAEAERDVGPRLDRLAGPISVLAGAYTAAGRYADARREHERGLALLRDSGLGESVRAATSLNNAALNLLQAGAPREALPLFEQTMALDRGAGTDGFSPSTAASYALALWQVGRNDEALDWATRAIEEAGRQNDLRALGRAQLVASRALRTRGDLQQAEALALHAATAFDSMSHGHFAHAAVKVVLGLIAADRGELQRAHDLLAEANETFATRAPRSGDRVLALAALADIQTRRGNSAAALDLAQRALDLARAAATGLPHSDRVATAALALCQARGAAAVADAAQACDTAIVQAAGADGEDAPLTRKARALRAALAPRSG